MDQRTLEINVISARYLKDVNYISKMDVYAVVSISGIDSKQQPKQKTKTPVDRAGGKNPTWNFPVKFIIPETPLAQNRLNLVFKLICVRALGDKDVGEVNVPLKELLDSGGDGKSMKFVSYQVRKPSGKAKGEISFSFKFDEIAKGASPAMATPTPTTTTTKHEPPVPVPVPVPVPAYPSVGPSSVPYGGSGPYPPHPPPCPGYAYPPPPPYAGYPHPPPPCYGYMPPPPGYGYPPVQGGYGYPPPVQMQQPPKNNKFGMGLGAGLLGGAVGGLLIGDMVSDAAAYDSGLDDAGRFDF